ncbi:hypothetical protein M3640_20695, partial [Bacillus velezensis]|nr:hypothetical protein [Bacillus velezensis]
FIDIEHGCVIEAVLPGIAWPAGKRLDLQPVEENELHVATGKGEFAGHGMERVGFVIFDEKEEEYE